MRSADPSSEGFVTKRALRSLKRVRPDGMARWSTGNDPTHTHAAADWRIVDGAGVLAAVRSVGLMGTMTGGRTWADALAKQNVVWERV